MRIFFIICLFIVVPQSLLKAQVKEKDSSDRFVQLNEVVVSSNKFNEKKKNIVQKIDLITSKYIAKINTQNTGDLLMSTGNVFVQKSQQGGSSPVIRGFEASRILMVVDGVRMNNAIYRAGHLQNVITVDQNMLQGVEVMYGPASTMYGSDALGGAIHMITKPVILAGPEEHLLVKGNVFGRYSTANNEKTGHFDLNLGYGKLGFLTSFTYSDFGDMKMGNNYPEKFPDFGRRSKYITQPNGSFIDSVVVNEDDRIQKYSGYQQWDFLQKIRYKQSEKINHLVNIQLSNSSNIPRYDRLQDERSGTLRYADWFYGPQKRNQYMYTLEGLKLNGFFNELRFTASYQDIEESRQTREYKRYDRFDSRSEKIKVLGFVFDTRKVFGNNELTIGADAQLNKLKSVANRTNLLTAAVSKLDSRYPNGNNSMNSFGIYAQHLYKFKNNKWVLNDGLRFQANKLHSTIVDNSFFNLPVTDIKQSPGAFTGNLGLVYMPTEPTRISFGLASGFRAPNIDDVARIFESSTALRRVVIPNPDVKPEYTYTADINFSYLLAQKIKFEAGAFYTVFRNAMGLAPFSLNGEDSILYNGTKSQVVANQNINKAFLYGFNAAVTADLNEHFSFLTTINYTYGRYKTDPERTTSVYEQQPDGTYKLVGANVSKKPLDHIPPVFGKTSIQYRNKVFLAEAFALYNGWKKLDQYNPDGEDNPQYATVDGMPGWITLNLRASVQLNTQFQIQSGIDNIFDRNYRSFGSGFSAPGRNFFITVRAGF